MIHHKHHNTLKPGILFRNWHNELCVLLEKKASHDHHGLWAFFILDRMEYTSMTVFDINKSSYMTEILHDPED